MTNKISSADEAISALTRLQSRSIPVRVNFSFPNGGVSFGGRVVRIDESLLLITGFGREREFDAPHLTLGPLKNFAFLGEIIEGHSVLALTLAIMRRGQENNVEAFRIHITAEWPVAFQHRTSDSVN
jgi:hypothetical protein